MFNRGMDFYGLKEVPGEVNNPTIMKWAKDLGHTWVQNDETAWCCLWINWLAWSLHLEYSKELLARSYLPLGDNIQVPQRGHIVVFWRKGPQTKWGHVGMFVRQEGDLIYTLGGNQKNKVCIEPYLASRLLAYRSLRLLQ